MTIALSILMVIRWVGQEQGMEVLITVNFIQSINPSQPRIQPALDPTAQMMAGFWNPVKIPMWEAA
jgi:hypothetical protein